MKIHISENLDQTIQGFTTVPIVEGEVNLDIIPNNSASFIVAIDATDSVNNILKFIDNVCSKMRLGGEMCIGGLDIFAVSRGLLSGGLNLEDYNNLTNNKRGVYDSKFISDQLQSHGLTINSIVYKGYNYEVIAKRNHDQN